MTPIAEPAPCSVCGASEPGGAVRFYGELHSQRGESVTPLKTARLCRPCFEWLAAVLLTAVAQTDYRQSGSTIAPLGTGERCDRCREQLGTTRYVAELLPQHEVPICAEALHYAGRLAQGRFCRRCLLWSLAILTVPAISGHRDVVAETPAGLWPTLYVRDAFSAQLAPIDAFRLEDAVGGTRHYHRHTRLGPARAPHFQGDGGALLFAGAGQGRAVALVTSLRAELRCRVVVVAYPGTLDDVRDAMRAGAGDFLASPLSVHQIDGAYERAREWSPQELDAGTGLRLLGPSGDAAGVPCQTLRVDVSPSQQWRVAWLLRRALRGYERVGVGSDGRLRVQAFRPDDEVDLLRTQLQGELGQSAHIKIEPGPVSRP